MSGAASLSRWNGRSTTLAHFRSVQSVRQSRPGTRVLERASCTRRRTTLSRTRSATSSALRSGGQSP
jgi:hypothetical protein